MSLKRHFYREGTGKINQVNENQNRNVGHGFQNKSMQQEVQTRILTKDLRGALCQSMCMHYTNYIGRIQDMRNERREKQAARGGDWVIDRPGLGDSCCIESLSD